MSASIAIHANGKELSAMPVEKLTTENAPTLVDILFSQMVADGTVTVVNGKMFFMGLAVSDMISITLGLISLMLVLQRIVVDFYVALYKRKAIRETEDTLRRLE
ncbi:hypothetical protein [Vibrio phage BONAISHI]|nr:hypothetical protein [Vibrio phage BONAISHI]